MFTPGGQLDLHTFAGLRKGGGGPDPRFTETTLTDPRSGRSFTSTPFSVASGGKSASQQLNEQIALDDQNDAQAKQDKATADATAAAAKRQTFTTNRDTAYNDALEKVKRDFISQGLDPNQYLTSSIIPALQQELHSVPDLADNPSSAFLPNLGTSIINDLTTGKRSQASAALNKVFTPGYENTLLPDSTTGSFIDSILGEQFDPLNTQLQTAFDRGTLTSAGLAGAQNLLKQRQDTARSKVQNLGQNILNKDRLDISGVVDKARSTASGLGLNDTFDPNTFTTQAQGLANTDLANFGGALRDAVGDAKFATFDELLNAGGIAQGPLNQITPNAPGGVGTGQATDDELAQRKRGLGNTGAF